LETVWIADSLGPVNQLGKHSQLLHQMVMRPGIQIEVSGLLVYFVSQAAVWCPLKINIQGRNLAICLHLHGELDAVEVKEEVVKFFNSVGPDHIGVIDISQPAERFVGSSFEYLFFKVLHEEVDNHRCWANMCPLRPSVHRTAY
jgi:hypothetical protein